jgi:hypothetical protein
VLLVRVTVKKVVANSGYRPQYRIYDASDGLSGDIYLPGHPEAVFKGKLDRLRAGERPHPLADPAAWSAMVAEWEAAFLKRMQAEKAR